MGEKAFMSRRLWSKPLKSEDLTDGTGTGSDGKNIVRRNGLEYIQGRESIYRYTVVKLILKLIANNNTHLKITRIG